jgi:hypothetical protein
MARLFTHLPHAEKIGPFRWGKFAQPFNKCIFISELLWWVFDFLLVDSSPDLAGRLREVKSVFALWR